MYVRMYVYVIYYYAFEEAGFQRILFTQRDAPLSGALHRQLALEYIELIDGHQARFIRSRRFFR